MEQEILTFSKLKAALDSMTPEQLSQPARFVGDNAAGLIEYVWTLEEDYVNPSNEGCEPISVYLNEEKNLDDSLDLTVVYPKGTSLLVISF